MTRTYRTFSSDEQTVLKAVARLNTARRTTNTSQVAAEAGLPRTYVAQLLAGLSSADMIRDIGKGAAYHWRMTTKGKQYQP